MRADDSSRVGGKALTHAKMMKTEQVSIHAQVFFNLKIIGILFFRLINSPEVEESSSASDSVKTMAAGEHIIQNTYFIKHNHTKLKLFCAAYR